MHSTTTPLSLEFFPARDGDLSARVSGDGFTRLLHSAEAPAQERRWFAEEEIWGDMLIAAGTGLGYHLDFLHQRPDAPPLLLCDAFAENLEQARKRLDRYPAPVICLHPGNAAALAMLLRPYRHLSPRRLQVLRHPAAARYCTALVDQVIASLTHPVAAAVPAAGPVALPFGNHFLQQELVHGLRDLGLEALRIPQEQQGLLQESRLLRVFQERRPQALISINGKGLDREGVLVRICRWLGIPVHVWFVDDPRPILLAYPREQWDYGVYWCWEKAYLPWLRNQGLTCRWLPLAGDPHLFHPDTSAPDLETVFTGSAMGSVFLNSIRTRYPHTAALEQQAQQLSTAILRREVFPQDLPGAQVSGLEARSATWFSSLAIHMASQAKRRQWLAPLLEQGLRLAGDPAGWREVLGPAVQALPDMDYRTGLRSHYRRGRLHINITSCQMPAAVNQRAFDIPLCGRMVLHDDQQDLSELFPADCFVQAGSPGQMADLLRFYRTHPEAAEHITENARQHILQHHTYAHRLKTILEIS